MNKILSYRKNFVLLKLIPCFRIYIYILFNIFLFRMNAQLLY